MADAIQKAKAFHEAAVSTSNLTFVKSSLSPNGKLSSHTLTKSTSFQSLFAFQKIASGLRCAHRTLLGSVKGELCYTMNIGFEKRRVEVGKKRRVETEAEDAERAVDKVKRSGEPAKLITDTSFSIATSILEHLLKLRGAANETCLESYALSLRKPGQYGASNNGKPSLVVAARVAAGVAVPMGDVVQIFAKCTDGLITTDESVIDEAFRLPMTEQGAAAHDRQQRSLLFLASVPHVEDEVAGVQDNKKAD